MGVVGRLISALAFGVAVMGCVEPKTTADAVATTSMRLTGGPTDAIVTVDDQPIGRFDFVATRGVALPPGIHRISVEAPGYLPADKEVQAAGIPVFLEIRLIPIPD